MFQLRGAYAILPHEMRIIQLILGGNLKATKENLRVTPGSFQHFVMIVPYRKRSGWQKNFEVLISYSSFVFVFLRIYMFILSFLHGSTVYGFPLLIGIWN